MALGTGTGTVNAVWCLSSPMQDFVDASHQTKWCLHAGCRKVVSYTSKGGRAKESGTSDRSEVNVECEDGHTFCW